jgi:hypothetical protein
MNEFDLDELLKAFLQTNIKFVVNNKVLREGRLMVFHIKSFYVSFVIKTKKDQDKIYEVPRPFGVHTLNGSKLIFDYSLNQIHRDETKLSLLINAISKNIGKKSKFFDNTLTIHTEPLS